MSQKDIAELYDRIAEVKTQVAVINNTIKVFGFIVAPVIGVIVPLLVKYLP